MWLVMAEGATCESTSREVPDPGRPGVFVRRDALTVRGRVAGAVAELPAGVPWATGDDVVVIEGVDACRGRFFTLYVRCDPGADIEVVARAVSGPPWGFVARAALTTAVLVGGPLHGERLEVEAAHDRLSFPHPDDLAAMKSGAPYPPGPFRLVAYRRRPGGPGAARGGGDPAAIVPTAAGLLREDAGPLAYYDHDGPPDPSSQGPAPAEPVVAAPTESWLRRPPQL